MTLIEIEKSAVALPVMVYQTPIWCFVVYETGHCEFDWMKEGKLGRTVVKAGSLTVNNVNYGNARDITDLADVMKLPRKRFCQIENKVYVRTENDNPLWVYYRPKYNTILGYTDEKSREIEGVVYKSGLDYVPKVCDEADNLEYKRMKFQSENITLKNTKGEYDEVTNYFGNNIRVKAEIDGKLKDLYEYYIKNVKIKEDKTTFICGDRREKLKQKVPNQRFTAEEYPKIKPELEGGIKQDVYGECEWVKCVCVDELDIFEDAGETQKQYRTFYVARKITELKLIDNRPDPDNSNDRYSPRNLPLPDHVWVKQTQPESEEEPIKGEAWTPCRVRSIDKERGEFTLDISKCMPPTWMGHDVPEVYEVRACGVFWAPDTEPDSPKVAQPLDIIKELLRHYCEIPYDHYWYDQVEIEEELRDLAPIGIVFDDEKSVFEQIEKLQNASDYGFRFTTVFDKFTARKDNNLRPPKERPIKITDIVDIGRVEIDMQKENYATIVDIAYKRNYYKETALHYEGRTNRENLLNIHGVEKIYEPETYLVDKETAKDKADRLEDFFCKGRVMINNVEVLNHPDLRVYDIVKVDLRIPIERKKELKQVAVLFDGPEREIVAFGDWPSRMVSVDFGEEKKPEYREFGGILTCKVMSDSLNTDTGVNTLNLLEVGL